MNIQARARAIVESVCPPTRRFVTLEEQTGIKAETWRTWWNRDGKPGAEMIEGLARAWPQFAFWLATGIVDFEHGHTAPSPYLGVEMVNDNGRLYGDNDERTAAQDFFRESIVFAEAVARTTHDRSRGDARAAIKELFASSNLRRLRRLRAAQEDAFKELDDQELALAYIAERRAPDIES